MDTFLIALLNRSYNATEPSIPYFSYDVLLMLWIGDLKALDGYFRGRHGIRCHDQS
jgi:hypothetical protein